MQPNGRWHIHDGKRPQPPIVTPGPLSPAPPPQDAIVLIGSGADRSAWQMMDGAAVTWPMTDGVLSTGKGHDSHARRVHRLPAARRVRTPKEVKGNSQERGTAASS
jgi:hypothetical protein